MLSSLDHGWRHGWRRLSRERSCPTSGLVSTGMCDHIWAGIPSRPRPCIPSGLLNRVTASAEVRVGMSSLPGGRYHFEPMWRVSSRSAVATLQTAIGANSCYFTYLLF